MVRDILLLLKTSNVLIAGNYNKFNRLRTPLIGIDIARSTNTLICSCAFAFLNKKVYRYVLYESLQKLQVLFLLNHTQFTGLLHFHSRHGFIVPVFLRPLLFIVCFCPLPTHRAYLCFTCTVLCKFLFFSRH